MHTLSEYVYRQWGSWGVLIFTLWALVLAMVALARSLLLTEAVELYSNRFGNQTQAVTVFALNLLLGLGFGIAAFGLWRRQNWGRILFLWLIALWSGFNFLAVFGNLAAPSTRPYSLSNAIFDGLRMAVGLIVSLWYFNIPRVKALFQSGRSEKFVNEDKQSNGPIP